MALNGEARVTWEFPNDSSKPPKRIQSDRKLPSSGTTHNTLVVSEDCPPPPPLPEVSEECPTPPPVNPPTPGWPSDPNIVTPNDVRQENNITLDDGHKTVNLSVGDMAQYDPKTD